jgi:hypothetical protein
VLFRSGTQNAGLAFGGQVGPPSLSCTEEYNGSSWTAGGALSTARYSLAGAGTQNAGLAFGGMSPVRSCTEEYSPGLVNTKTFEYSCSTGDLSLTGTTILSGNTTVGGNLNVSGTTTGTFVGDGSGLTGIDTDPFPYSGNAAITGSLVVTANTGNIEFSYLQITKAWSSGGALITARRALAGAGTQTSGLAFGGYSSGYVVVSCTEEYNGSSWSSGGALSTARYGLAGAGTQNAGLAFGGSYFSALSCTEEYDGSTWSAGGALSTARYGLAGAGTQNAALAFGGSPARSCTEEYDGSTWSTGGALITGRRCLSGAGTQNDGLAFGGAPGQLSCTEEYNGTSWSAGGALSTARDSLAGAGTQNAALAFGGDNNSACTEEYDGSSWSASAALSNGRSLLAGAGTQNEGLAFGGYIIGFDIVSCTEEYISSSVIVKNFEYSCSTGGLSLTGDEAITGSLVVTANTGNIEFLSCIPGTLWSTGGALITARQRLGGLGTQNAGLAFGGQAPTQVSCTEEYDG